jgi:hypothetical protein
VCLYVTHTHREEYKHIQLYFMGWCKCYISYTHTVNLHAFSLTLSHTYSNQFGKQEPWEEEKIKEFARGKHGAEFFMSSKVV